MKKDVGCELRVTGSGLEVEGIFCVVGFLLCSRLGREEPDHGEENAI